MLVFQGVTQNSLWKTHTNLGIVFLGIPKPKAFETSSNLTVSIVERNILFQGPSFLGAIYVVKTFRLVVSQKSRKSKTNSDIFGCFFFDILTSEISIQWHPSWRKTNIQVNSPHYLDVSNNRGTPKWMVKIMENPYSNGWFGGKTHYFWKHPSEEHFYSRLQGSFASRPVSHPFPSAFSSPQHAWVVWATERGETPPPGPPFRRVRTWSFDEKTGPITLQ